MSTVVATTPGRRRAGRTGGRALAPLRAALLAAAAAEADRRSGQTAEADAAPSTGDARHEADTLVAEARGARGGRRRRRCWRRADARPAGRARDAVLAAQRDAYDAAAPRRPRGRARAAARTPASATVLAGLLTDPAPRRRRRARPRRRRPAAETADGRSCGRLRRGRSWPGPAVLDGRAALGGRERAGGCAASTGRWWRSTGLPGVAMSDARRARAAAGCPARWSPSRRAGRRAQAYEYTGGLAPGRPGHAAGPAAVGPARARAARRRLRRAAAPARRRRHLAGAGRRPAATAPAPWSWPPRPASVERTVTAGRRARHGAATPARCRYRVLVPPGAGGRRRAWSPPGRRVGADAGGATSAARRSPLGRSWPVRRPRPCRDRLDAAAPLLTGQRVLDAALPGRPGQHRRRPRRVRHRQDDAAAADRQVVRRRRHRLRRLRRARQRDGRRRSTSSRGSPTRAPAAAGRPDRDHRQHLEHADDGARGQHLHRGHRRRVLPRHGPPRRRDRRLHVPLGGGAARVRLPLRRAAGRGGLPGRTRRPRSRPSTSGPGASSPSAARRARSPIIGAVSPPGGDTDRAGHRPHRALRAGAVDAWTATWPTPATTRPWPGPARSRATPTASRSGTPATATRAGRARRGPDGALLAEADRLGDLAELVGAAVAAGRASGWCCSAAGCCARAVLQQSAAGRRRRPLHGREDGRPGRRGARGRRRLHGGRSTAGSPPPSVEEVDFSPVLRAAREPRPDGRGAPDAVLRARRLR